MSGAIRLVSDYVGSPLIALFAFGLTLGVGLPPRDVSRSFTGNRIGIFHSRCEG